MSEEIPNCCPACGRDDIKILGKLWRGFYGLICNECGAEWLLRDVTGIIEIFVEEGKD